MVESLTRPRCQLPASWPALKQSAAARDTLPTCTAAIDYSRFVCTVRSPVTWSPREPSCPPTRNSRRQGERKIPAYLGLVRRVRTPHSAGIGTGNDVVRVRLQPVVAVCLPAQANFDHLYSRTTIRIPFIEVLPILPRTTQQGRQTPYP